MKRSPVLSCWSGLRNSHQAGETSKRFSSSELNVFRVCSVWVANTPFCKWQIVVISVLYRSSWRCQLSSWSTLSFLVLCLYFHEYPNVNIVKEYAEFFQWRLHWLLQWWQFAIIWWWQHHRACNSLRWPQLLYQFWAAGMPLMSSRIPHIVLLCFEFGSWCSLQALHAWGMHQEFPAGAEGSTNVHTSAQIDR